MKVLFYNDPSQGFGGAETYCNETIHWLIKNGIDVQPFFPNIDVSRTLPFYKNFSVNHFIVKQFQSAINDVQPDIIHLNKNYFFAKSIAKALMPYNIPIITTVHDYFTIPFPITIKNRVKKWVYPHRYGPGAYIIPSAHYFNLLREKQIPGIHYIPHFLDMEKWPFNEQYQTDGKELLYVGRLEKLKGILGLVKAVGLLAKKDPSIHLTIIGSGNEEAKLAQIIHLENLAGQITLAGPKPQPEVLKYFHRSTLCIVPSLAHELFGLVGLEAQASGLPVLATNLPGIREWCLHGESGMTVQSNCPVSLASAIETLLAKPSLREGLRQRAREFVREQYSPEKAIESLLFLYGKLTNHDPQKALGEIPQTQGSSL